ncbi:DUF4389 domain-containing protein [Kitasatospora sp. McL0602]|uniref:DUF4389 domain-containing protein n=1 Tax=Kitasatospora sp. McL0602 TaxID=3439530 RepID=UPI003F88FDD4
MAAAGGWHVPEAAGKSAEWLPTLDIPEPTPQRRLTVLLRWLLLLPHFLVLLVLSVVATVTVVLGWFAALVLGRLPDPFARLLTGYVGYVTRLGASAMLLVDTYPPFALHAPGYPVQIELRPGPLNRLAVFFRIILIFPAAVIQSLATTGWGVLAVLSWLVVLITGRAPRPLFEATAATLRYSMRYNAYGLLLTPAYPKRLFGDTEPYAPEEIRSATRPLRMSTWGTALLVVYLVAGVMGNISYSFTTDESDHGYSAHPAPAARR